MKYSYSKLTTFAKCKLQYKLQYLDKLEVPKAAAMLRGIEIHDNISKNLLSEETKLALSKKVKVNKYVRRTKIREIDKVLVIDDDCRMIFEEQRLGCNDKWLAVNVDSPDCRFNGVVDYAIIQFDKSRFYDGTPLSPDKIEGVTIYDWKSGKSRALPFQMHCYVLLISSIFHCPPSKFDCSFVYVDTNEVKHVKIPELNEIQDKINDRIQEIESCQDFCPSPTPLCDYCGYRDTVCKKPEIDVESLNSSFLTMLKE
jgi:hypothetical protein